MNAKRATQALVQHWREEQREKYEGRSLFVRGFDENVTEEELIAAFKPFGEIEGAKIARRIDEHGNEGESKKFGFVCFKNVEDASKALKESAFIEMGGVIPYICHLVAAKDRKGMDPEKELLEMILKEAPEHARAVTHISREQAQALIADRELFKKWLKSKDSKAKLVIRGLPDDFDAIEWTTGNVFPFEGVQESELRDDLWHLTFDTQEHANKALQICNYALVDDKEVTAWFYGAPIGRHCVTIQKLRANTTAFDVFHFAQVHSLKELITVTLHSAEDAVIAKLHFTSEKAANLAVEIIQPQLLDATVQRCNCVQTIIH